MKYKSRQLSAVMFSIALVSTLFCFTRNRHKLMAKMTTRLIPVTESSPFTFFKRGIYKRKHEVEKPIVIIIPSYNNVQYYYYNLASVFEQQYTNYRVIFIADGCGCPEYDGTGELTENLIVQSPLKNKFTIIKNKERKGALYNLYHAICSCDDNEIVVTLDGDDWFYHDRVLSQVNDIYTEYNVWVTHGRFIEYPTRANHWSLPIPTEITKANKFRSYRCPSHLRTFYAWLFKKIELEDLMKEDQFYAMTWDQAMMFPMFEMAGERHYYIESPYTYVYNVANAINDCKVNAPLQRTLEEEIRSKMPYTRL